MKHNEHDVEELVQAAVAWASSDATLGNSTRLHEIALKFRPKPPRVGVVEYYAGAYKAIELTDEVREALKVAGIEWEE